MTWDDVTQLHVKAEADFEDGTLAVLQKHVDSIKKKDFLNSIPLTKTETNTGDLPTRVE